MGRLYIPWDGNIVETDLSDRLYVSGSGSSWMPNVNVGGAGNLQLVGTAFTTEQDAQDHLDRVGAAVGWIRGTGGLGDGDWLNPKLITYVHNNGSDTLCESIYGNVIEVPDFLYIP